MNDSTIPTWIKVFAWILAIFGLCMGIGCYVAPDLVVSGINTDTAAGIHAMGSLGGRNLAMGVTLIVALLSKRPGFLMLALIMRLVTEITDMFITVKSGIYGIPAIAIIAIWILCLIIPEIIAIRKLKSMTPE